MNFLKKHKWKLMSGAAALIILVIAFMMGGNQPEPGLPEKTVAPTPAASAVSEVPAPAVTPEPTIIPHPTAKFTEKAAATPKTEATVAPTEKPKEDAVLTCVLSVRCDTILANMSKLNPEKASLVPPGGVIFPETEVVFYKGESVLNVLSREMKKNKIHLEFVNVPMYNSAYIEGIANLYERDCGELSGWMYKVNGYFHNYGSSRYILKDGDRVEWIYTCDLGNDIGGGYSPRNGRKDD